jgi:rod shape-determining protein MreC
VIATSVVAITLIGIVGISIGRYSGSNPIGGEVVLDIVEPVGKNLNSGFTFLKDNFKDIINYKNNSRKVDSLQKENQKLKEEIISLNSKLDEVQSLENLKKSLNFIDEKYQARSISTRVVGKNDGNWYDSFVIGAGKKQGVKKDSIVMNGNGLVGVVYEVSENYSKAISLLDTKSSVSFKLLKDSKLKGVISQNSTLDDKENYKNKGYLYGYMFDSSYNVLPGDVLTTSGLGIYPKDIPIGEVDKVIDDKNKSMKFVVVKPYVNFKNIDDVVVIEPRNIG